MAKGVSQTKAMYDEAMRVRASGDRAKALELMVRLARRDPRQAIIHLTLAAWFIEAAEYDRGLYHAEQTVALAPENAAALSTLATAHSALNHGPEAEKHARRALEKDPNSYAALNTLAVALSQQDRRHEAVEYFARAHAMSPDRFEVASNYSRALAEIGEIDRAIGLCRDAIKVRHDFREIHESYTFILNYSSTIDPRDVLESHRTYGRILTESVAPLRAKLGPPPAPTAANATETDTGVKRGEPWPVAVGGAVGGGWGRRLRVGFISGDFCRQSVSFFALGLIEHLDPARFDVHLYYNNTKDDAFTARYRSAASSFKSIHRLDTLAAAKLIRADGIDILIDLAGVTWSNRLDVMALKPAPVQATYCGYCNTTGLSTIDYRIVDTITDPVDAEPLTVETLARLERCFLAYRPDPDAPDPAPEPPSRSGPITFGSFNVIAKVSDLTLDMWTRVLAETPGSRMLIKAFRLDTSGAKETLIKRLTSRGIDPARVDVMGWVKSPKEHLDMYGRVDVALDTTPYSGTTTTCEALWMGVPVITLAGRTHAARVSASLLSAIGHPELIARTPEDYVRLASTLAADTGALTRYRAALRQDMAASPLRDEAGLARAFGAALERMWSDHLSGARDPGAPTGQAKKATGS
jgi:predicted O-linked N-acetylglucosamine transferase (SPINDLY family)